MIKILFSIIAITIVMMSCTKDDLSVPDNSSIQLKEGEHYTIKIISDLPIVNDTITATIGTLVNLFAVPSPEGYSYKWTINGKVATHAHGPSVSITSTHAGTFMGVYATMLDASDHAWTSPRIRIKWVPM